MTSPMQSPMQPIMRSPLSGTMEFRRRGGGSFDPVSAFFGSGEQGIIYDLSVMASLFQDSAGTVPVTAADQPVGKILDLSGNGNHATQPTAGKLPLLKTDGTYWWLEGDSIDDCMITGNIDFTGTDKITVFAGVNKIGSADGVIYELGPAWWSINGGLALRQSGGDLISASHGDAAAVNGHEATYAASLGFSVVTSTHDISGDLTTLSIDGGAPVSATADQGGGNFSNSAIYLLMRGELSFPSASGISSLVIRGAATDAEGISNGNAWTAARCGVTL